MTPQYYPKNKILATFILLGGILGGLIALIFGYLIAFLMGAKIKFHFDVYLLQQLLSGIFGSFIIGLVPMFMIGSWIVNRQLYLKNNANYFRLFVLGCLVTALPAILVTFFLFPFLPKTTTQIFAFLNIIGSSGLLAGISSIILGHFIIPKKEI